MKPRGRFGSKGMHFRKDIGKPQQQSSAAGGLSDGQSGFILFRAPKEAGTYGGVAKKRATVEDVGLEGCAHARPQGKRQVLLMDREKL